MYKFILMVTVIMAVGYVFYANFSKLEYKTTAIQPPVSDSNVKKEVKQVTNEENQIAEIVPQVKNDASVVTTFQDEERNSVNEGTQIEGNSSESLDDGWRPQDNYSIDPNGNDMAIQVSPADEGTTGSENKYGEGIAVEFNPAMAGGSIISSIEASSPNNELGDGIANPIVPIGSGSNGRGVAPPNMPDANYPTGDTHDSAQPIILEGNSGDSEANPLMLHEDNPLARADDSAQPIILGDNSGDSGDSEASPLIQDNANHTARSLGQL